MKHTKGPWYPVNYSGFIELQTGETYGFSSLLNEDDCEEAIANGILAASAPELLELLKVQSDYLDILLMSREIDETFVNSIIKNSNELITKATGGN